MKRDYVRRSKRRRLYWDVGDRNDCKRQPAILLKMSRATPSSATVSLGVEPRASVLRNEAKKALNVNEWFRRLERYARCYKGSEWNLVITLSMK
jgi:hypothetical protein